LASFLGFLVTLLVCFGALDLHLLGFLRVVCFGAVDSVDVLPSMLLLGPGSLREVLLQR
jgi:hypothetical protein